MSCHQNFKLSSFFPAHRYIISLHQCWIWMLMCIITPQITNVYTAYMQPHIYLAKTLPYSFLHLLHHLLWWSLPQSFFQTWITEWRILLIYNVFSTPHIDINKMYAIENLYNSWRLCSIYLKYCKHKLCYSYRTYVCRNSIEYTIHHNWSHYHELRKLHIWFVLL